MTTTRKTAMEAAREWASPSAGLYRQLRYEGFLTGAAWATADIRAEIESILAAPVEQRERVLRDYRDRLVKKEEE